MNTMEQFELREQLSALADGQLSSEAFAAVADQLGTHEDARTSWHLYHLIGDVLRSGEIGSGQHDREFVARLRARLQAEPGMTRPARPARNTPENIAHNDRTTLGVGSVDSYSMPAANDGVYRWKILAGLATVVAVAAVAWSGLGSERAGVQLAQPVAPTRVDVAQGGLGDGRDANVMIRDPHLDALLAAHRQFGGTSALQNPAGFLRSATFDASASRSMRIPGP